jgi:predicted PhzF superfamily epimerase YddE/YHI9
VPVPLFQIDAFTSEMFAGNPAGVCFLPAVGDDARMQANGHLVARIRDW